MTNIDIQNKSLESNALIYAQAFLIGFNKAIEDFYSTEVSDIISLGFPVPYLALLNKTLDNISIKVFISEFDFFLFFVKLDTKKVEIFNFIESGKYNRNWCFNTPSDIKTKQILVEIKITPNNLLDKVNISGTNRYLLNLTQLKRDGESHGNSRGISCGKATIELLPSLKKQDNYTQKLISFLTKYNDLKTRFENKNKTKKEALLIGHEFETLWRDILNFWNWQAKKIEIAGEKNDFTAMYKGNHIVGECRWVEKEQDADDVRAFVGKLDPRAKSIGLMVAYSGFNTNAIEQARRAVQSRKTLVLFKKEQIERIILDFKDPSEVMDKELREVLDFLYEK